FTVAANQPSRNRRSADVNADRHDLSGDRPLTHRGPFVGNSRARPFSGGIRLGVTEGLQAQLAYGFTGLRVNCRDYNGLAAPRPAVARGCVQQGGLAARERVLEVQDRCPIQPDPREIAPEDVVALRADATLDPGYEIVERLLPCLTIETAVTGRAN